MSPVESYITRLEAAKLSKTSESAVNKAIEQKVIPTRRRGRRTVLDAADVATLVAIRELRPVKLPLGYKRRIRSWLRDGSEAAELTLTNVLAVRRSEEVEEALQRAKRYVELRERYLEVSPGTRGGEPVIRGTRVPIRGLAKQIELGEAPEVLREDYPRIDEEAYDFAVMWARMNPKRGRPTPMWGVKHGSGPAGRAAASSDRSGRRETSLRP